MRLKAKPHTATAIQYLRGREQEKEILDAIGPGSHFLRTKFEPKGGPNPNKPDNFYLCSGKRTWVLQPGEWLVVFDDQNMEVMNEQMIQLYFEEEK